MSTVGELTRIYASLILHDDRIPITAEKISTLVKIANVEVEAYWPSTSAKLVEKKDIAYLITNTGPDGVSGCGAGVLAAPVTITTIVASTAPAEVEKKKEPKEDSDDEIINYRLFCDDLEP